MLCRVSVFSLCVLPYCRRKMDEEILESDLNENVSLLDGVFDFGEEDVVFAEAPDSSSEQNTTEGISGEGAALQESPPNQVDSEKKDVDPFFAMEIDNVQPKSEIDVAKACFRKYMEKPVVSQQKEVSIGSVRPKKNLPFNTFTPPKKKMEHKNGVPQGFERESLVFDGIQLRACGRFSMSQKESAEQKKKAPLAYENRLCKESSLCKNNGIAFDDKKKPASTRFMKDADERLNSVNDIKSPLCSEVKCGYIRKKEGKKLSVKSISESLKKVSSKRIQKTRGSSLTKVLPALLPKAISQTLPKKALLMQMKNPQLRQLNRSLMNSMEELKAKHPSLNEKISRSSTNVLLNLRPKDFVKPSMMLKAVALTEVKEKQKKDKDLFAKTQKQTKKNFFDEFSEKKIDEFMKLDNDRCKKEKIWNLS